ncbi:I78 family peptidase inhibitor [Brevundimonas sp.]|uniref:I78 family peptidase inhibitor n=1 Tax=Brevundimonas sp. TaxID=1871086 RepID=UPI002D74F58F|nr:I78 family peptidase inhibitor [Brevundimonas sp.]HYC98649.1 I78 family peptidase inhibitor [Brevundimonas sp.]
MRLIVISLATVVALAACTEQAPPAKPAGDTPPPASSASTPTPPPVTKEPTPTPPADACGAAERQNWVGRARSSLPSAPAGAVWRIYETGQPVTMDFSASRLNIEINPDTQTVVRLSCG